MSSHETSRNPDLTQTPTTQYQRQASSVKPQPYRSVLITRESLARIRLSPGTPAGDVVSHIGPVRAERIAVQSRKIVRLHVIPRLLTGTAIIIRVNKQTCTYSAQSITSLQIHRYVRYVLNVRSVREWSRPTLYLSLHHWQSGLWLCSATQAPASGDRA